MREMTVVIYVRRGVSRGQHRFESEEASKGAYEVGMKTGYTNLIQYKSA